MICPQISRLTCQAHGKPCVYNFDVNARITPSKAYINALKTRIKRLEDLSGQLLGEIRSKGEGDYQQRGRQAKPQGAIANSAQDVETQPYEAGEDSHALDDQSCGPSARPHGAISAIGPISNLMGTRCPLS